MYVCIHAYIYIWAGFPFIYLFGLIIIHINTDNFSWILALGGKIVEVGCHLLHGSIVRWKRGCRRASGKGIGCSGVRPCLWGIPRALKRPSIPSVSPRVLSRGPCLAIGPPAVATARIVCPAVGPSWCTWTCRAIVAALTARVHSVFFGLKTLVGIIHVALLTIVLPAWVRD